VKLRCIARAQLVAVARRLNAKPSIGDTTVTHPMPLPTQCRRLKAASCPKALPWPLRCSCLLAASWWARAWWESQHGIARATAPLPSHRHTAAALLSNCLVHEGQKPVLLPRTEVDHHSADWTRQPSLGFRWYVARFEVRSASASVSMSGHPRFKQRASQFRRSFK